MTRATLLALALLLTIPAFASYELDPPAPTDRSLVTLVVRDTWGDGCIPRDAQVTRSGNRVDVRWTVPRGGGCTLAVEHWIDDVPLGQFAAGTYTVHLGVDDILYGPRDIATRTLIVTQAQPGISITPNPVSTAGGTEIEVALIRCVPANATLSIDDVVVASRIENCHLKATAPAHAAGAVNVKVVASSGTFEAINALRYIDPAGTPDRALYERVLVPVILNGPGAFGSQWETEVVMTNVSFDDTIESPLPDVARPLPRLNPLETISLSAFGNRPSGLILFLPRGHDARFGARFRDVSREAETLGTELPVVRERDANTELALLNVPFDPRYRLQLRIYSMDGVTVPVGIAVMTQPPQSQSVTLLGPCGEKEPPCNSNQPAYASVDLNARFPSVTGRVRLAIYAASLKLPPLWAFVTATNNETQDVTVISPQ